MISKRRVVAVLIIFLSTNLYSLRLDIKSDINTSLKSFSNLIYQSKNYNLSYIKSNIDFSLTLKDIVLEKTNNSYADVSVGFKALSVSEGNIDSKPYLKEIYDFYGTKNTFFPYNAYVRLKNFPYADCNLTSGRLSYTLSNGVVLSDNSKGLDGFKIDIINSFADIIELFYFRTFHESNHNISGVSINKSFGDGVWQVYLLKNTSGIENTPLFSYAKTNKTYTGISYFIDTKKLLYSFEFATEGGKSTLLQGKEIKHSAYALNLKALWNMEIAIIGKIKARAEYTNSSGGGNLQKDKTFYSAFSKRFCGFERCGVGEIFATSIWSAPKSSNTVSGLPQNIAGIRAVKAGFDILFNKYTISFDFYRYTANSSPSSKDIGKEQSIRISKILSEKTSISTVYSKFKPEGAFTTLTPSYLFSFEIKTGF